MGTGSCLSCALDVRDSSRGAPPADALIVQEDRNLVLSAPPVVDLDQADDVAGVYRAAEAFRPVQLGRFLVQAPTTEQPRWLYRAVVHDLESWPSARPDNVRSSLGACLTDVVRRGLGWAAMEPLGVWGSQGLRLEEMARAFDTAVRDVVVALGSNLRLTLLLDRCDQMGEVGRLIRDWTRAEARRSLRSVADDIVIADIDHEGTKLLYRFPAAVTAEWTVTRA